MSSMLEADDAAAAADAVAVLDAVAMVIDIDIDIALRVFLCKLDCDFESDSTGLNLRGNCSRA